MPGKIIYFRKITLEEGPTLATIDNGKGGKKHITVIQNVTQKNV
jgi:hypothetical protein